MNKVLIVAAHADDEVLGCAGTIAKHIEAGDFVTVVFMTDGVSSRARTNQADVANRTSASQNALAVLGVSKSYSFTFPDNKMDSIPLLEIVQKLESVIEEIKPNIVYTHFGNDLNIDHQITNRAVLTGCRPQSWGTVKEIFCFEVLSATEWGTKSLSQFIPHKIVDITGQWDKKAKAVQCYSKEMRDYPHSRNIKCIESLAVYRGASHGVHLAEAFYVERIVS